jgi:PAS domain S-box-containing protein
MSEAALGQPLVDVFRIINEETRQPVGNPTAKVLQTGRTVGLANHTVLLHRDGSERPIADSAAPIFDAAGRILGVVLVFHDIVEQRRAEEALAEQHELLAKTLESIGDAVIATDAQGAVVFMNPVGEKLTGVSASGARGKSCREVLNIINEITRQPIESPIERVLREKVVVGLANHALLIARDGTERPIDDSAAPIRSRTGDVVGVVMVFRDVTERRRATFERDRRGRRPSRPTASRTSSWRWCRTSCARR